MICFEKALELNTSHFLLWLELGLCQQHMGLIGPARNSLAQAHQLNPGSARVGAAMLELSRLGVFDRIKGSLTRLFNR
jgi:tetratricopeptide (TPR) repeat protein